MSLFNFNIPELLTFFAVLVRYSVLFSILPFIGDKLVPGPVKILLAVSASLVLYPALVASGKINPAEAKTWAATSVGIFSTIGLEIVFGLALGFTCRLVFDSISVGANFVGSFMGFATASQFDPHQESQTEVIAQFQTTIAMLLFLVLDGHHIMIRAALDSYRIVGLGRASLNTIFSQRLIHMTGQVLAFGLQIAGPVAVSIFSVNIIFAVLSKAMPQLNVMVLSLGITTLLGFSVIYFNIPGFQQDVISIFGQMNDWMEGAMIAMASRS
ncbi:MAG: flagellar biosynthetic protein FliR [Bdellovibrionia bacterium]